MILKRFSLALGFIFPLLLQDSAIASLDSSSEEGSTPWGSYCNFMPLPEKMMTEIFSYSRKFGANDSKFKVSSVVPNQDTDDGKLWTPADILNSNTNDEK